MTDLKQSQTRIVVFGAGTRGDIQPAVALALGLQDAKYKVLFVTSPNHEEFVTSFGLDTVASTVDTDLIVKEDPGMRQAMETGDTLKFFTSFGSDEINARKRACIKKTWAALMQFKPQLILSNHMALAYGICCQWKLEIPLIWIMLQTYFPTVSFAPFGLPNLPFGCNWYWYKLMGEIWYRGVAGEMAMIADEVGERFGWASNKQWLMDVWGGMDNGRRIAPWLMGVSRMLEKPRSDWPGEPAGLHIVGPWTIPTMKQEASLVKDVKSFSNTNHSELMRFLNSEIPCVYMGWGSMIAHSKEHMTRFAVRTLKCLQMRGIILRGWAGLTLDCLGGAEDEAELRAYCQDNVIFVEAAPHPVVFPKCACIVHHGGAGTTICALQSAQPMVITPVWLDQFDYADVINRYGCGVGLQKFREVSVNDLVGAIRKCMTEEVKANALHAAELIKKEADGVGNAVQVINTFMNSQVHTMQWKRAYLEQKRKYMPGANLSWCGCAEYTHDDMVDVDEKELAYAKYEQGHA